MPTTRRRRARAIAPHRVTPVALEAWRAGDWAGLHRALALRPWQASPLDVDPERPVENDGTAWAASWPLACELRAELLRRAGPPGDADE